MTRPGAPVHEQARSYLDSRLLPLEGCLERLREAFCGEYHRGARQREIAKLEGEAAVLRYLLALLPKDARPAAVEVPG